MKLSKAIIKKYGITKKAWAVARKGVHKVRTAMRRSKSKRKTHFRSAKVNNVARKRRSFGRSSSQGLSPEKLAAYGFAYGVVREPLSRAVSGVAGNLIGGVGDEVALGVLGYLAAKKGSGIVRDAGKAMLTVEAHNLGRQVSAGGLNILGMGSSTTAASNGATF